MQPSSNHLSQDSEDEGQAVAAVSLTISRLPLCAAFLLDGRLLNARGEELGLVEAAAAAARPGGVVDCGESVLSMRRWVWGCTRLGMLGLGRNLELNLVLCDTHGFMHGFAAPRGYVVEFGRADHATRI